MHKGGWVYGRVNHGAVLGGSLVVLGAGAAGDEDEGGWTLIGTAAHAVGDLQGGSGMAAELEDDYVWEVAARDCFYLGDAMHGHVGACIE